MPDILIILLSMIGVVIAFPLFWVAVVFLVSRLTGWATLARHFAVPPDRKVSGESFGWSSVQFNLFGRYSNCIDIVVSRDGLYLRPVWPFRFGHEPLLISWSAIEDVRSHDWGLFTANDVTVRPNAPGGRSTKLTLAGKRLGESLTKYAEKQLRN